MITHVVIHSPIRTEKRPFSVPTPVFHQSVQKNGLFQYQLQFFINPYGKTALFSTNSSFSSIRTEKRPISVRIRVGPYTTRSQTSTKHASSTSTNHSLLTLAISSFPDVTNRELKQRRMAIFVLTLHVRKTGIVHRDHRRRQNRDWKCHGGSGIALFQIVLGLMCSGGLSGGGESQNEAKSRRFGMDLPSRAFYEG